jgi:hypothetical protein
MTYDELDKIKNIHGQWLCTAMYPFVFGVSLGTNDNKEACLKIFHTSFLQEKHKQKIAAKIGADVPIVWVIANLARI